MPALPALFPVKHVDQVALVVRDLDQAMRRYWELPGVGPWRVYTYGPPLVRDMTDRGRKQDYRMRLALAHAGETMVELIQPLEGPNVYDEHLERKGEGLHHIGVFVPSFDEAVAEVKQRGYAVLQSGRGYGRRGRRRVRVSGHRARARTHPGIDRDPAGANPARSRIPAALRLRRPGWTSASPFRRPGSTRRPRRSSRRRRPPSASATVPSGCWSGCCGRSTRAARGASPDGRCPSRTPSPTIRSRR